MSDFAQQNEEIFLLSCIKMAKIYLATVRNEILLYNSRTKTNPLECDFSTMVNQLDKVQVKHSEQLEYLRNGYHAKKRLKRRDI